MSEERKSKKVNSTTSTFIKTIAIIVVTLSILAGAHFLVPHLFQLDLGQVVTQVFFVYPAAAFLLGAASALAGLRIWTALVNCLLVFTCVMLLWFNDSGLVYIPVYGLAAIAGFGLARLATGRARAQTSR